MPVRASIVTLHFGTNVTTSGTSITFDGTIYHNGDSHTFDTAISHTATANPDTGYAFAGWQEKGNSVNMSCVGPTSNAPSTTVYLQCDGGTLIANFGPARQVTFTTNPTSGVSITWTPFGWPQGVDYTNGQTGSYVSGWSTARANPLSSGDTFSYWSSTGGVSVPAFYQPAYPDLCNNPANVNVSTTGSLVAVFNNATPPKYAITFSFNSTRGYIRIDGASVSDKQVSSYVRGCHKVLPLAQNGYDFSGWTVTGGVNLAVPPPYGNYNNTVVLTGNGTLTANFGLHRIYFITNPSGAGSITFNGKTYTDGQSDSFEPGTTFTASATPKNSSYVFKSWSGDSGTIVNSASANPTTGSLSSQSNGGSLIAYFTLQTSCGSSCRIQINSTATISNVQYNSSTGKLSFNATGPTGGSAFVTVAIPVSSGIKISQLTILVNNTPPPLPFTYRCDNPPNPSPCTAASFYSVTFNLHFSNDYVLFYLRGTSANTPPLLAIIIALLIVPVLLLYKRRRSLMRYNMPNFR